LEQLDEPTAIPDKSDDPKEVTPAEAVGSSLRQRKAGSALDEEAIDKERVRKKELNASTARYVIRGKKVGWMVVNVYLCVVG
jgi:hypothetical protein